MKRRPHRAPPLTLADRLVSAGFAAFFGAIAAIVFSLFMFRGANVGAGVVLLAYLGWFAGGFAVVGFVAGPAVADLIGEIIALSVSDDQESGSWEVPTWLAVVIGLVAIVAFLVWAY